MVGEGREGDCYLGDCVGNNDDVGWGSGVLICGVDGCCFVVGRDDGGAGIDVFCTDDCVLGLCLCGACCDCGGCWAKWGLG